MRVALHWGWMDGWMDERQGGASLLPGREGRDGRDGLGWAGLGWAPGVAGERLDG